MHVRRTTSRSERALDTAKGTAKDLGTRAGEAAHQLGGKAQTTLVPAVEQAARTAGERYRADVQPALATAASSVAASAAAVAESAREEARTQGAKAEKRTRKARKRAKKRSRGAAARARAALGREQPKRHRLRKTLLALGLAGAVAWIASRAAGSTGPEPVRIPTTPTSAPAPTLSQDSESAEAAQAAGANADAEDTVAGRTAADRAAPGA